MFRLIFRNLLKQKRKMILIVIQLIIAIISLLYGSMYISYITTLQNNVHNLVKEDYVYPLIDMYPMSPPKESECELIKSTVKSDDFIESIGTFCVDSDDGRILKPSISSDQYDQYNQYYIVKVDQSCLQMMNFNLSKGSRLPGNYQYDLAKEVPILISDELSRQYKVGSKIQYNVYNSNNKQYEDVSLKVIGICVPDQAFLEGGLTFLQHKKFIIMPLIEQYANIYRYFNSVILKMKDPSKKAENFQHVQNIYDQMNLDVKQVTIRNFMQDIEEQWNSNKEFIVSTLSLAAILFFLTMFGLWGVLLSSINKRKMEFGIRYACGATKASIIKLLIGEVIGMYLVALIIVKILYEIVMLDPIEGTPDPIIWVWITVITLGVAILTTIIPIQEAAKLSPIELIREKGD